MSVRHLSRCELCPRRCGVDRLAGERGFCQAGSRAEVYRSAPHFGEEPPVSGTGGSGTVFFGRCTLRCLYCQNYPWSQEGRAQPCGVAELAGKLRALRDAGCHNWNLVSPTPWLPLIRAAVGTATRTGARLPIVYNTSGFERVETLREFADLADVFLVDLRYAKGESARVGSSAPDYVAVARAAVEAMWRRTGPLRLDRDGVAVSGTICRVLILPGHADEAVASLEWLAAMAGPEMPVSVMAQYVPTYRACEQAPWNRAITAAEYEFVCGAVAELGFTTGWVQEFGGESPAGLVGFEMPAGDGVASREGP